MESLLLVQDVTIMEIGAVLIAAGCGAAPVMLSGNISVAQRMIASLQKAGANIIAVVTGPEDKKLEKQLSQTGVLFLRNDAPEDEENAVRLGLNYLESKCDRVFLLRADRPLIDPETLRNMLELNWDLVVPVYQSVQGQPMLLRRPYPAVVRLDEMPEIAYQMDTEDAGVVLSAAEAAAMEDSVSHHDRKLTRPVMDFAISRGKPVLDSKLMTLLWLIRETQSVRDACNRMQISYSTAWNLLNGAEDSLGYPLISRNKGGPSGSGSLLTEKGSALLSACEQFETAAREKIGKLYEAYFRDII